MSDIPALEKEGEGLLGEIVAGQSRG